jgi:hypothetical protein
MKVDAKCARGVRRIDPARVHALGWVARRREVREASAFVLPTRREPGARTRFRPFGQRAVTLYFKK